MVDSIVTSVAGAIRCWLGDVLVPQPVPVGYRVPLAEVPVPAPPWIGVMPSTYFLPSWHSNFPYAHRTEELAEGG